MERRKTLSLGVLALCIAIIISAQPVVAQTQIIASGLYSLRLDSYGIIMDQSGRIVGWSARLTGTVHGYFEASFDSSNNIISGFWLDSTWYEGAYFYVDTVNLMFTWYRGPLGLTGKMSQNFYFTMTNAPLFYSYVDWLNGQYVDSAIWRVNAQMAGPLYASISLNVRWKGPFAEGRTGTITGKFKGGIPIPNTPGYMFVPTGGFSYGVNVRGTATIGIIAPPPP